MAKTRIVLHEQGLDGMINAMRDVQKPTFLVTHELETVLDSAFGYTQARTHIISGRLKASGRTDTDFNGKVWSGTIEYGGSKYIPPGYTTAAYYAVYEEGRGGEHDFLDGLEVFDDDFVRAIDSHFKVLL